MNSTASAALAWAAMAAVAGMPQAAGATCAARLESAVKPDAAVAVAWNADGPDVLLVEPQAGTTPLPRVRREPDGPSGLYTPGDGAWWVSDHRGAGWSARLLSHEPRPQAQRAVATLWWKEGPGGVRVALWPGAGAPVHLERLYAMLLGVAADMRAEVMQGCEELGGPGMAGGIATISDLLRLVAQRRAELGAGSPAAPLRRWKVVDIQPLLDGDRPSRASVRVTNDLGPLADAQVAFARDPHMACTARTDAAGVATCELADTYGHGTAHDTGPTLPPLVATFSGRVEAAVLHVPLPVVFTTPPPTRCLTAAVPAEVAATWDASCLGFAPRAWRLPEPAAR